MADLSKVRINGVDYDLKDIIARQNSGGYSIYYLELTIPFPLEGQDNFVTAISKLSDGDGVKVGDLVISSNGTLCKVIEVSEATDRVRLRPIANIGSNNSGGNVDLTGYATEEFVKNKIAEAQLGDKEVDLSGYAQKSELPTKVSQLQNDSGYLTQHQDITGLLPRTELTDAINTALAQAKESGEFKGEPGYTPQKNIDYFDGDDYVLTAADKEEIAEIASELVEVPDVISTPEMFGAVGNGTTDDTEAIRSCINYANQNGLNVKFTNGKKYKVNQKTSIVAHCSIDFNSSTIILSGGSVNPFIKLEPLTSSSYTLTEDSLTEYAVTDERFFNKCITVVSPISLGIRNNSTSGNMPFKQTLKTDMNGNFINGKMECEIISGSYTINNVHDYMAQALEIKNAIVDYSQVGNNKTAIFIDSYRSNVKFDNINITGKMNISNWSYAVLGIYNCCNIEISNIRGNSPYSSSSGSASGYIVGLYEASDVYMHDCDFGGSSSQWGCIGISYISNFVAERVNTNRFDCHYYFTGYFTVRDCTTNRAVFCGGNGEMVYERVNFITPSAHHLVERRADLNLMPNGIIRFDHCIFKGEGSGSNYGVALVWKIGSSPDSALLSNIKYNFTHFIFDSCKINTTNKALTTFDMASGWDNVSIDIINTDAGERTLYSYGSSKVKRGIIRGCTLNQRINVSGCDEVIIKECRGDTVYVANTTNTCMLCDNIFTPTSNTEIYAGTAFITNNIILADSTLKNSATKYLIANNLSLYGTSWANASK